MVASSEEGGGAQTGHRQVTSVEKLHHQVASLEEDTEEPPEDAWAGTSPTPCTLHPAPYTLHPTPFTLHPAPYTLHPS